MDRRAIRGYHPRRSLKNGLLTEAEFSHTGSGRLFTALCAQPHGMSMSELIDAVYGHRADGGPDRPELCIYMFFVFLRRWLAKHYPLLRHHIITGRRHILVIRR